MLAGLTAAAVVVPKAMAYASIAGLPLQVGLYTAFIPMVVYAVLGTSRVLSTSTTTGRPNAAMKRWLRCPSTSALGLAIIVARRPAARE